MGVGWRTTLWGMLAISGALTLLGPAQTAGRSNEPSAAQPLAGKLIELEERSYAAWKSHDTKFWPTFLSEKFVGWGHSGRLDKRSAVRVLSSAAASRASS